jgi:hypothetical protein
MTTLTKTQAELLASAAASPDGVIALPKPRPTGLTSLIKQGYLLVTTTKGEDGRIKLTDAGRAVVALPWPAKPKSAPSTKAKATAKAGGKTEPAGKLGLLIGLLRRKGGASIADLMAATGWQAHSVRGAMSTAKKKQSLEIVSEKTDAGRIYRISEGASA